MECLGRLARWREKRPVKVIGGIRGSGKTTLLAMYTDWLKRTGVDEGQIVHVNMEAPEAGARMDFRGLYDHVKKRLCESRVSYVFIDEVQKCPGYEKAIAGLLAKRRVDLYVAASSIDASLFPQHVEIPVLPLSFAEYLLFSKAKVPGRDEELKAFSGAAGKGAALQKALPTRTGRRLPRQKTQMEKYVQQEAFNNYLSFGGFPFAAAMGGDAGLLRHCIDGIYSAALIKDVAQQAGINDIPLLESVARLMSQSTGHSLSSTKIGAAIDAGGRKISANTVETYMKALSTAFVFLHAGRFDIKAKKHLKTLGKYYIADTGIRNMLLEAGSAGLDGQLENIVYLELLRRGFRVCIGKLGGEEVNFAVFWPSQPKAAAATGEPAEGGGQAYFQVAASVRDKAALAGKLSPLLRIPDNHPKFILSLDETPLRASHSGIIQRNLIEWLLEPKR